MTVTDKIERLTNLAGYSIKPIPKTYSAVAKQVFLNKLNELNWDVADFALYESSIISNMRKTLEFMVDQASKGWDGFGQAQTTVLTSDVCPDDPEHLTFYCEPIEITDELLDIINDDR